METLDRPLRFERIFLEKVWGGRALERAPGIELPPEKPIGETWEVVDRSDHNSAVATGPLAGRSLGSLMEEAPGALLGSAPANAHGRFPLLLKYLDARLALSVQVHPDDAAAERIGGGAEGKTEAWYVLEAEPGAKLYCGLKPEVTREEFARHAASSAVLEMLQTHEVRVGDALLVPGGTVHAIGEGLTLVEVQQNSDTTYRIWDWDRVGLDGKPRDTHVEAALEAVAFGREPVIPVHSGASSRECLLASDYFTMESSSLGSGASANAAAEGAFWMGVLVAGSARLEGPHGTLELRPGDSWLVPAETRELSLTAHEEVRFLRLGPA